MKYNVQITLLVNVEVEVHDETRTTLYQKAQAAMAATEAMRLLDVDENALNGFNHVARVFSGATILRVGSEIEGLPDITEG